jgi:ABC-type Na+ efflux pump permease subunit
MVGRLALALSRRASLRSARRSTIAPQKSRNGLTYASYAIWLLTLLAWLETARGFRAPRLLYITNPFWLLFGARSDRGVVPLVECVGCAFMVSIGLSMVSVTSASSLAEERAHGSLDLLMTTPISTRALLLGKWRGSFRAVPSLAILPAIIALGSALMGGEGLGAVLFAALIAALVTAYGAVITSLGLALATWQARLGRAVGLSVAAFLAVTVIRRKSSFA